MRIYKMAKEKENIKVFNGLVNYGTQASLFTERTTR